jgi:hypothetical protein
MPELFDAKIAGNELRLMISPQSRVGRQIPRRTAGNANATSFPSDGVHPSTLYLITLLLSKPPLPYIF